GVTTVRWPNSFCKVTHTVDGKVTELWILLLLPSRLRRLVPKRIRRFTELFGNAVGHLSLDDDQSVRSMKGFSLFVLESTLELAARAMPHDGRVGACVEAIRRCLDSSPDPEHDNELRSDVTVLLE